MKNALFIFLLAVFSTSVTLAQSAGTKTTKTTKSPSTTAATSSTPRKAKSGKKRTSSGVAASSSVAASSFRARPSGPTPERYREIQQALVDKGYLKSEPDGVWDTQSTDALRQFQTDQKLTPTGKITAASLIGLGLGPKDSDNASSAAPAETPPSSR